MFKKTLLATALSVAALNANAVTTAVAGEDVSVEGVANEATLAQPVTTFVLGAEYTVNDIITLTVSNAEIDSTATPALAYADTTGGGNDTMTLGLLSTTATTATFRITDITLNAGGDGITTGDTLTLTGLVIDGPTTAALASGTDVDLTYTATATGSNLALDTGGTPTDTIFSMLDQFSASVTTSLDEVVDVDKDRQEFVGGTTDVLVITPVEAAVDTADAAYDGATYVISGNFAFADTDQDGAVSAAELDAAVDCVATNGDTCADGTHALSASMDSLTITVLDGAGNVVGVPTVTFNVAGQATGNPIVDAGSFSVASTINYTPATGAADTKAFAAAAAGAWTLNGKVATINYMPFGDNTQVIMRATNTGSQTGDVTVRYMLEGVDSSWNTVAGTVTTLAPGVTNIADLVMNAIKADAGVTKGKVAIEVTANVPTGDATIYAAYKVVSETDRGFVGNF